MKRDKKAAIADKPYSAGELQNFVGQFDTDTPVVIISAAPTYPSIQLEIHEVWNNGGKPTISVNTDPFLEYVEKLHKEQQARADKYRPKASLLVKGMKKQWGTPTGLNPVLPAPSTEQVMLEEEQAKAQNGEDDQKEASDEELTGPVQPGDEAYGKKCAVCGTENFSRVRGRLVCQTCHPEGPETPIAFGSRLTSSLFKKAEFGENVLPPDEAKMCSACGVEEAVAGKEHCQYCLADVEHPVCPRCLECAQCNLRPCRGGGPHMPGVERSEAWRLNKQMAEQGKLGNLHKKAVDAHGNCTADEYCPQCQHDAETCHCPNKKELLKKGAFRKKVKVAFEPHDPSIPFSDNAKAPADLPNEPLFGADAAKERIARRKANEEFAAISKKYWQSIPVKEMTEVLNKYGFNGSALEGIYTGRDGRDHTQVGPHSWIALQWHKMEESGRYEINAYLS